MLPGLKPIISLSSVPAEVEYIGGVNIETNLSTYNFNGQAIGSAEADRFVILGVQGTESSGASDITSVTCNGNAMTLLAGVLTANGANAIAFYGIYLATGTTADFVVTFANTRGNAGIVVYKATKLQSSTPVDTDTNAPAGAATDAPVTIDKPSSGFVIALSLMYNTGAGTCTWTNLAEDFDGSPMAGSNGHQSGASEEIVSGSSGVTITPSWSAAATARVACVAIAMR